MTVPALPPAMTAADVARLRNVPAMTRLIMAVATRLRSGRILVTLPDGRSFRFEGREPGPEVSLHVNRHRTFSRLVMSGNVGFAEAYIDGDWDSPDVAGLLDLVSRNTDELRDFFKASPVMRLANRVAHLLRPNTKAGARRNIHAHYDLGNAFYSRWLDPTMTYSSARFLSRDEDLSAAQTNKYRALADLTGLQPGHHVLEIGAGWGGFAEFAAREIGCRVTGITISREQHEFARRRMFEQGLAERVSIELRDYRDVDGQYDRIASIEMFEAVGERYWPAYFGKVRESLKPGGTAGLQIITISDTYFPIYRRGVDFIQKYVFPGGMLPSKSALDDQLHRAGLMRRDMVAFGQDYAETLARWRDSFVAAWDDIRGLGFDDRFRRLWTYYLSYCEAGFRSGTTDVVQITAVRT